MNKMPQDIHEDEPLDPAAEKVRRKMVRLLAVSIGIMFAGVFAVLFAIVYRLNEASVEPLSQAELVLPPGFVVEETDIDSGSLALTGSDADGVTRILIFDRATGTLTGDHALVPSR